jgi:hypothetical protein
MAAHLDAKLGRRRPPVRRKPKYWAPPAGVKPPQPGWRDGLVTGAAGGLYVVTDPEGAPVRCELDAEADVAETLPQGALVEALEHALTECAWNPVRARNVRIE